MTLYLMTNAKYVVKPKQTIMKTIKIPRSIQPPKKKYYFGKAKNGCPYFYPLMYVPFGIRIQKGKPMIRRAKWFCIGDWFIEYDYPIRFGYMGLVWKDKFGTPRFEWGPQFYIYFFGLEFHIWWVAPDGDNDQYYEQLIWINNYCDGNVTKARDTWEWQDYYTKLSTWKDYQIK